MKKVRIRRWGTQGKGFRLWGSKAVGSYESQSDDEELLYDRNKVNYTNTLDDTVSREHKKRPWRPVSLDKKTPVIPTEDTIDTKTHAVFPGGIFLHMASNPNPCDILLTFHLGDLTSKGEKPSFVLPPQAAVYDHEILEAPFKGGPRSETWCDLFGIITKDNLERGIVRHMSNDRLVVWRKFRHRPDLDTPFALYKNRNKMNKSEASYMIYSQQEYDKLLRECCGVSCNELYMTAEPLLDNLPPLDLVPILVHVSCPAVISEEYTEEVLQNANSYVESDQTSHATHTISNNTDFDSNNYTVDLDETNYLQTLADTRITSETKLI